MSYQSTNHLHSELSLNESEELLALLLTEDTVYPWYPPTATGYYEEGDRAFSLDEAYDSAEMDTKAQDFFASLNRCFSASESVVTRLRQQFAQAPQDWLEAIAHRARELAHLDLAPTERLVQCVKPLLSQWSEDDLLVFARPVALAMRSQAPCTTHQELNWEQCSAIEKARYTMNAAQCAFEHLEDTELV
ncbi:MAG: hypothetical protein SAJ12_06505 [Jaaginema sp. PMC 1079.18]|nr:hypothetical protein [Jaaginema sp. PMC 1080.18]MEC4850644.1 hypothetical protein [Jaaginema sp. PMC 1079.18]MEC4867794.1 hypothetical protein [Jaaginema sp. PMC 1078.18]